MQTQIDLSTVELVILGDFNVLTLPPFRNNGKLEMLPGRKEYLLDLLAQRTKAGGPALRYAITGNKGGVAYGLQTEDEAREELRWTAEQIQAVAWVACFGHPEPKPGYERYANTEALANRKPAPGMLEYLIEQLGVEREKVLVVGIYSDDGRAAFAAGLRFQPHGTFFRGVERYIAPVAPEADQPPDLDLFDIDDVLLAMEEE